MSRKKTPLGPKQLGVAAGRGVMAGRFQLYGGTASVARII
jgi:hypothetical protein